MAEAGVAERILTPLEACRAALDYCETSLGPCDDGCECIIHTLAATVMAAEAQAADPSAFVTVPAEALRSVLDYLHEEERDFEECGPADRKGHIWLDAQKLKAQLPPDEESERVSELTEEPEGGGRRCLTARK